MTTKDFKWLAYELSKVEPETNEHEEHDIWLQGVRAVTKACIATNGAFNTDQFIEACHYDY